MPVQPDVVIVGGGSTGTSTAFQLARLGYRVTVFEKNSIGSGQSGFSEGFINAHTSVLEVASLRAKSLDFFTHFEQKVGEELNFTRIGMLFIFPSNIRSLVQENIATLERVGLHHKIIANEEAERLVPQMTCKDPVICVLEPDAGFVDPMSAVKGFAHAAEKLGTEIRENVEVTGITTKDGRVTGVKTDHGDFPASKVFLATAAWTNKLLGKLGTGLSVYPDRNELVFISKPETLRGGDLHPLVADFTNNVYFMPQGQARITAGYIGRFDSFDEVIMKSADPDNFSRANTFDIVHDISQRVVRRIPIMREGHWETGYACVYDVSPDYYPILDEMNNVQGLYVAAGLSGQGFHQCPWIGEQMARFMVEGKKPSELVPFRAVRFKEGMLLRGSYPA